MTGWTAASPVTAPVFHNGAYRKGLYVVMDGGTGVYLLTLQRVDGTQDVLIVYGSLCVCEHDERAFSFETGHVVILRVESWAGRPEDLLERADVDAAVRLAAGGGA